MARSLKNDLEQLLLDMSLRPPQALLTQVTMARNRVHHTVTGAPPSLEMTGRCDFLSGHADAWNHDPQSADPAARQLNSMRNILNARNAIVSDGEKRALAKCDNRNLPDRSREFAPVGSLVQIEFRGEWVGAYRAAGLPRRNVILDKRRRVFKRPKYKIRMPLNPMEEGMVKVGIPSPPGGIEEETDVSDARVDPKRYHGSRNPSLYDAPQPMILDEDPELFPDDENDVADLPLRYFAMIHRCRVSHQFRGLNFTNQGILVCEDCDIERSIATPGPTYSIYNYSSLSSSPPHNIYSDPDILDHFDPSRIPPRVDFQDTQDRLSIQEATDDLIRSHDRQHPAMQHASLGDPQYKNLPRAPSTLAVMRMSDDLYKGKICTRGDVAPLYGASFMRTPANRFGAEMRCTLAPSLR